MNDAVAAEASVNLTTQQALEAQPLAPRFYRTDYAAMEKIDIEPVRAEWDLLMRDFELDKNRGHFKQNYEYDPSILESDPDLKEEFLVWHECVTTVNDNRFPTRTPLDNVTVPTTIDATSQLRSRFAYWGFDRDQCYITSDGARYRYCNIE